MYLVGHNLKYVKRVFVNLVGGGALLYGRGGGSDRIFKKGGVIVLELKTWHG